MAADQEYGCSFVVVGNVRRREYDQHGTLVAEQSFHNTVTSGGLSYIRDFLLGPTRDQVPLPPSYFAVGSGLLPVGRYAFRVPGETCRTPIVQRDPDGQSVIFHAYLEPQDNVAQTVGVYGLIAGDASDALGTGTLIAIALEPAPFNKNAANSESLDWTLTVSGRIT